MCLDKDYIKIPSIWSSSRVYKNSILGAKIELPLIEQNPSFISCQVKHSPRYILMEEGHT